MPSRHGDCVQIEALRQAIARLEGIPRREEVASIPTGFAALDAVLPQHGLRGSTLVEWLAAGEGAGASSLALRAACQACRRGGGLVVLDRTREFYPPAAIRLGIEPARLIVVHAGSKADHDWALDQSLRCPAVAAVVAWPDAVEGRLDGRTFRRLQLAVEEGGGLGLLVRPETVRSQPSWADVRLLVEPLPSASRHGEKRRLKVLLLRCRGGSGQRVVEVEIGDETHPVPDTAGS